MKRLLFVLILLPFISMSQSRLDQLFFEADSAFNEVAMSEAIQSAKETDSICGTKEKSFFYETIWISCISSSKKRNILLSEDEALNLYLDGYMDGQLSYFYDNAFGYERAYNTLKKIKKELKKFRNHEKTH